MKDKIISRMEQLSENMSFLVGERERKLQELSAISNEIDTTSVVLFELKSLLEEQEQEEQVLAD